MLAIGVVLLIGALNGSAGTSGSLGVLALFVAAGFRLLPSITSFVANSSNIKVGADSLRIVHDEVLRARHFQLPEEGPVTRCHLQGILRSPTSTSVIRDRK